MEIEKAKYSKTELGNLPSDWEIKRLDEIGANLIGLTYSPKNVKPYGHLVLRSSNIQDNKLAFENNVYVQMELPDRVVVRENDILICVRNGSKHLIGKCALIDKKTAGSAFGAFMSIYRTPYANYVFHQFQSNIIQKQIDEVMGATINQLTNKDLASFRIPIPKNRAEQDKIANVLTDTDNFIYTLSNLIDKKEALKKGATQKLLKPQKGWQKKKLNDFLIYEQPSKYIVKSTEYDDGYPTPVLTAGKSFILGYTNETNGIFTDLPVIIFDDFTTAIKYVDFPFKVKSSAMKILKPKDPNVNLKFIYEMMTQINFQVADHKRHWIGEYNNLDIFVPKETSEQNYIAQILFKMDNEISALKQKLEKYRMIKVGLMQNLLTGKIRLQ